MEPEHKKKAGALFRSVILFQLKLLLGAGRDLVLMPVTLVAALFDFLRMKTHEPEYYRQVLRIGEKTDRWIDVWYSEHDAQQEPRENVHVLLNRVESVVRDPKTGAHQARVLKRWAERQMQRAAKETSKRMKSVADQSKGDGT
jgi:hypothetical protein